MKLCDALTLALRELEVEQIFGVSGANIEHLYDSVFRLGEAQLGSVLCKTEAAAAFMADARARTHDTLGVCCATSGGGMMNLAVGLAESFASGNSVLGIVGQIPRPQEGRGGFQDSSGKMGSLDALAFMRSFTRYTARVESPEDFWPELEAALRAALGQNPGPAALLIPRDLWEAEVGEPPAYLSLRIDDLRPAFNKDFLGAQSQVLAKALTEAKKPVIALGAGFNAQKYPEITEKIANLGIPCVVSLHNPGAIGHDHPSYAGKIGILDCADDATELIREADLVLGLGRIFDAMGGFGILEELQAKELHLVDQDCAYLVKNFPRANFYNMPLSEFIPLLGQALPDTKMEERESRALVPSNTPPENPEQTLNSPGVVQALNQTLLRNEKPGVIFFDAGNCASHAASSLHIPTGWQTHIALGMGGMGYAVAGASGAILGRKESGPALVICGDGSFLMHGMEIHTALEHNLPIVWIIFNDGKHGMCVTRQEIYFPGPEHTNTYNSADFGKIGDGLGAASRQVHSYSELLGLLEEMNREGIHGPHIIDCVIEDQERPPFKPFRKSGESPVVVREPALR